MTVQQMSQTKKIDYLFHFTRIENLASILTHGLLTKSQSQLANIPALTNDQYRYDAEDAICLSIGFPNYKMFYRLRRDNPESDWVVLGIRPAVLWEKDCAFCVENAARKSVSCIPIGDRKGPEAFELLFRDFGDKKRNALKIPDKYPTNPQAEVLVFGTVEPRYIVGLAFSKLATLQQFQGRTPIQMLSTSPYFGARSDYAHWTKQDG